MLFVALTVGDGGTGAGLLLRPLVCGFGLSDGGLNIIHSKINRLINRIRNSIVN